MGTVTTSPSASFLSPSDSLIITSPALSVSSSSSFDFVTFREQLGSESPLAATTPPPGFANATEGTEADNSDFSFSDENDEAMWRVSDSSDLEESHGAAFSDDGDDFVVLHRTRSPVLEAESSVKAETATTSVGTIRGIPLNIPFGLDSILDDAHMDEQDSGLACLTENSGVVPSKLRSNFGVCSKPLNETDGIKTPVNPISPSPASRKKRKAKQKRTPEEEAKRQRKKERKAQKKRERKAAQTLKELQRGDSEVIKKGPKGKNSGRANVSDTTATPVSNKTILPPVVVSGLAKSVSTTTGGSLTCNPVVAEKVSEQASGYNLTSEAYNEAANYITSFLSNPSARRNQACHLALLQSLIIELGLLTDRRLLPQSISSAKKFIHKHAFINIKDYLTRRHEGQTTVKGLLYNSKSALVRDLKRKRNYASPAWVKERGLQDLLVPTFHRH